MADVSRNASFPQDEVDLHKQNRIQSLLAQRAEPGFLAEEKMAELVYGSSPYGHIAPTPAAVQKLDAKTLAGFRDTYLVPNNATLLIVGKLPAREELMKIDHGAVRLVGAEGCCPAAPKMDFPAPKRQIVLVDRPGSVQADIHVGRLAPTRLTPGVLPADGREHDPWRRHEFADVPQYSREGRLRVRRPQRVRHAS